MTQEVEKVETPQQDPTPATQEASPRGEAPQVLASPQVDLLEGKEAYLLRADLPGVTQERLTLHLEGQELTLEAEQALEGGLFAGTKFVRKLTLPREVDTAQISAQLTDGVLDVHMPRRADTLPRQIPVNLG
jgi:HSP20 family molecular chaperone IbpA